MLRRIAWIGVGMGGGDGLEGLGLFCLECKDPLGPDRQLGSGTVAGGIPLQICWLWCEFG